jgi:alcohol dehydrogenase class IV
VVAGIRCLGAARHHPYFGSNILQACAKPEDLQARGAMQVGSFLAGVAFSHSMVGMVHGIAHALGGVYHIPHGLANALVLPEVMAYNLESQIDRYADIALAMGISFPQVINQSQSLLRSPVWISFPN